MLHASLRGRFERAPMCRGGVRRANGADGEHAPSAGEGRRQTGGPLEIAVADGGAAPGGVGQRVRRARYQDQLGGVDAVEQRRHDEAAERSRRPGYHQTHERPPHTNGQPQRAR